MRDSGFLEDELMREDLAACSTLLAATSDNFAELVAAVGISPATDLMHADLRRCDFSNSDVRGFNFSGSDLRDVVIRNTQWDASTIFDGADVSGTGFAFDQAQRRHFAEHPEHEAMVRSLASSDWLGVEVWLGKDRKTAEDLQAAGHIAFKLYNHTDQPYIRSIILFYSRYQFAAQRDYRDFLLAEIGRTNPPAVIVTCLTIVGRLFAEDEAVRATCRTLLSHDAEMVRRRALEVIMNGVRGLSVPRFVIDFVRQEESGEIRRYYLGRVVRRMSKLHEKMARDGPHAGHYRDFRHTISEQTIADLATGYLRNGDDDDIVLERAEAQIPAHIKKRREKDAFLTRKRRQKLVRMLFDDFRMAGIVFNVR